ncbi:MAG: hypothetical protein WCC39_14280 [Telluria sp.]
MLKVTVHSGLLASRSEANQLAVLDVAYQKKSALADYVVALSLRGSGEVSPAFVRNYPRWSASVWDLVARALAQTLYRADQIPPSAKPDRRCAYATRICASIERMTAEGRGHEVGTVEILQESDRRGVYTAMFDEDVLGPRRNQFEYGCKALNPAELLMRAICWTYFDKDVIGPIPKLLLPTSLKMDGLDYFHLAALDEPALTEFQRYRAHHAKLGAQPLNNLQRAEDYVRFLMEG